MSKSDLDLILSGNYKPSFKTKQSSAKTNDLNKILSGTYKPEFNKNDYTNITKTNYSKTQNNNNKSFDFSVNEKLSKQSLINEYKDLQKQLANYDRKEKTKWWDSDKNILENSGNVLYKLFVEDQDNKYKNDEEYNELLNRYKSIKKQITDETVKEESKDLSNTEKIGYTLMGNLETSLKGIESTVQKFTGQNRDNSELSFGERMAQESIDQSSGAGKVGLNILGSTARMIPQVAAGSPVGAKLIGFANYGGSAYNEAKRDGYDEDKATKYGVVVGSLETGLESLLGGFESIYGKSIGGKLTNKVMKNIVKNDTFRKTVSGISGEFTEEYLQEFLNPIVKNIVLEEENGADFWNTMQKDFKQGVKQLSSQLFNSQNLYSGMMGAMTSGVISGINNLSTATNNRTQPNNVKNNIISTQNITDNTNNSLEAKMSENVLNQVQNNINNYQYQKSNNIKIDNLRKSASTYFDNSTETKNLINTYEKIITDKNYNVIFDNTLTNNSGNIVDAKISTLDNGETEIRINPNSTRAGEFLIMHEVTHAIETDEIKNLVIDYASKNSEFNNALESLKQTYNTSDVSSEVLADISGQLFGNQEFINELSIQKPNVFTRIYNKIIELANKITGNSKESLFLKDLKNKWENAYRTQNNILNDSKYMMTGVKGLKNAIKSSADNQWLYNNYNKSKILRTKGYDNNIIRQKTGWFIGTDGKERFEISDNEAQINGNVKKNAKYKLDEILNHDDLYELYPKLRNSKIIFKDIKNYNNKVVAGQYNPLTNSIELNNKLLDMNNSLDKVKNTLLHEIQHNIQKIEKFNKGSAGNKGIAEYINNAGEIEARDTEKRSKLSYAERLNSRPKSMKTSTSNIDNKTNILYNLGKRKDIDIDENIKENSSKNKRDVHNRKMPSDRGGRELNNSSFSLPSNEDSKWQEHLESNYKSSGTRTDMSNIKSNSFMKKSISKGNLLYDIDEGIIKRTDRKLQLRPTSSTANNIQQSNNIVKSNTLPNYSMQENINNSQELESSSFSLTSDEDNNATNEIPKDPTKEESYNYVDNYNVEINNIKNMLSKYTSLERSELISEKTYDSINSELRRLGKGLDDKTIDNLTNKIFKNLIDGKDIKNITNTVYNFINNPRKAKINEYRKLASNMIDDIVDWNDKKIGLSYQTETMKRNLYDIIPDKNKAKQVYETYFQTISENEATAKNFINEYNDKIKKLDLNNKESIAVQMYGEYKYNPETTLTGLQVYEYIEKNNLDLNKIKNSVEVFRDTYDELINKVNNVLIEQGYKPIEYRKGYFPHFVTDKSTSIIGKFAEKLGWKIKKENLPTDIAGMTEIFKPGKRWTSFSQQRTGDSTDYNALKGFDTYIRGAADLIYHTEDIQKLRALENEIRYQYASDTIKKEIDEINKDSDLDTQEKQEEIDKIFDRFNNQMPNFVTEIRRYTDGLANKKAIDDRNMEHKLNREIYSVMTNIQNRVSANMVGLNVSSALTNFIPITQGYSQISTKNMLKAIKDTISNQVNNDGFENSSTFLTNRLKNPDNLYKTGLDKFNDKASFLFEGIDSITSNILVRGKYYDNVSNGISETEAIKNADEFAKDVMAGRSKGEMPTIYNEKNPITKLLTSFQLEVKNQYGYMFKDIPRDLKDKGMKTLVSAFMKMYLGAWLYNKFAESLTGRKSAFSPVDIVEETLSAATNKNLSTYDKLENITTNALQEVPYIGGILGGGRLPINSAIPDVKTFEYFVNSFSDDKDKKKTAINNLRKELTKPFMYIVMPVGGGQIKKTVEGLSMYSKDKDIKGSYTTSGDLRFPVKEDILSKTQAALFGQYSSKEAREYFDRGEKPLTENQIEDYKNLNVPITKYWKYRSDLREINKIKSDKDENGKSISGSASGKKAYEIMNNNLYSKKEKNYLLSQLSSSDKDETIESLKILDNDKEVYKYYFGLNTKGRENFVSAINDYDFSAKDLYDFNTSIDKEDSTRKKITVTNYLKNSNLSDKQIAYLYEKSGYSSEEKLDVLLNSNISLKSFIDLQLRITDIKGDTDTKSGVVGKTISGSKKKKVLKEINETKGLSKEQKLLTTYLLGYSVSTGDFSGYTTDSSRKIVFDYVNKLRLSTTEKRDILEQAGYKIYKNGRIGW
ncbi:MAG: SprT family zinc-dependent metalloprotease [Firmicutes bacterium]|nr:SprT family zinc-dependent metalloprotease [Bacillota bacterium]